MTSSADDAPESGAEAALESVSRDLIESISTHAIFKLDATGHIESWPDSAKSLYGYEATTIAHRHFGDLFADEAGPNPNLEAILSAAKPGLKRSSTGTNAPMAPSSGPP